MINTIVSDKICSGVFKRTIGVRWLFDFLSFLAISGPSF